MRYVNSKNHYMVSSDLLGYGLKDLWSYGEERLPSMSRWSHTIYQTLSSRENYNINVYVADIVVIREEQEEIMRLKSYLAKEFEIKDLGKLWYFLGIEVARSQQDYKNYWFLNGSIYKIYF